MNKYGNLARQTFSYFFVLEKRGRNGYLCRCICGELRVVNTTNLVKLKHKSCGCKAPEIVAAKRRKPNNQSMKVSIYNSYRLGAIRRGYAFDLALEDVVDLVSSACHYCGLPASNLRNDINYRNPKSCRTTNYYPYNGIDRVENSKGYTKDNCVPCCTSCNHGKGNKSVADFLAWALRLHEFQVRKNENSQQGAVAAAFFPQEDL